MSILKDLRTAYGVEDYHRRKPFFDVSKNSGTFFYTDQYTNSRLHRSTMPRGPAYLKLRKLEDRAMYLKLTPIYKQHYLNK